MDIDEGDEFSATTAGAETPPRSLRGAEKRKLRGVAQRLDAKLAVGKNGVSADVVRSLYMLFKKDALVKVRFAEGRAEMKAQIAEIERRTGTLCIGNVGRTATFFRLVETVPAQENPHPAGTL